MVLLRRSGEMRRGMDARGGHGRHTDEQPPNRVGKSSAERWKETDRDIEIETERVCDMQADRQTGKERQVECCAPKFLIQLP